MAPAGARFIMGVRRGESLPLEAHAWVESEGQALSGASDYSDYQVIFEANRNLKRLEANALS